MAKRRQRGVPWYRLKYQKSAGRVKLRRDLMSNPTMLRLPRRDLRGGSTLHQLRIRHTRRSSIIVSRPVALALQLRRGDVLQNPPTQCAIPDCRDTIRKGSVGSERDWVRVAKRSAKSVDLEVAGDTERAHIRVGCGC